MYSIANKHLYVNPNYDYIKNASIKEWDMKAAGLSILISKGKLTDKQIDYYSNLPKKERNIKLGLLRRKNKELNKVISEGLKEYRYKFFESNNIDEDKVLSIRSDAIFLVNSNIKKKEFDNVKFRSKNSYTAYYQLNKCDFFYSDLRNILHVKGIDDNFLELQEDYFLKELKKIFRLNQISNKSACNELYKFADKYRKKKLDVEYYRELDKGLFRLKKLRINGNYVGSNVAPLEKVDIRYNYLKYILPLISMIY